jgi:threonine/homoserine/homoserine lactone efflux protein
LLYLGFRTFTAKLQDKSVAVTHVTLLKDFLSTFFLTLTNPLTILSYLAIFAGVGIMQGAAQSGGWLVVGVLLGSGLWWVLLSEGVTLFRKRVSDSVMVWINRIAGMLIAGFGLAALISANFS